MIDLKKLNDRELLSLIESAQKELQQRSGKTDVPAYDREFRLSSKAYMGCSYEQVKYAHHLAEKTSSLIEPNNSQLMKKFEAEAMTEAITLMEKGKCIHIY